MADPGRVLVAGDWHGNTAWALGVIRRLPELLPDEVPRIIVHCGDFGIWPGPEGARYLRKLDRELARVGGVLWFVDGNHEDHRRLAGLPDAVSGHGRAGDRILHLRRGQRWNWHGRTWLALGGAVSIDRADRVEGRSWWPEEEITAGQARQVTGAGRADVMVTHDCPAGVPHTFSALPAWLDPADLVRSDAHRGLLQTVVDQVRPAHLIHGHLHRAYERDVGMRHGTVHVTGLDCDGVPGNWALLDPQAMRWGEPGRTAVRS